MAELRQYRYLVEVVRRGTFTAAAEALHVTQSTLSEQIIQLEREFGCRLLNRRRLGVTLTPAGEYVLSRAQELVRLARELEVGALAYREDGREALRLATSIASHHAWLAQATVHFSRLQPRARVLLELASPDEVEAGVAAGRFDLGILPTDPEADSAAGGAEVLSEALVEEDMVVVSSYDHYLADVAEADAEDLANVPLVTYHPAARTLRPIVDRILEQLRVAPAVAAETASIEHMWRLVGDGAGIAIMPRSVACAGHARGLRAVELPRQVTARRRLVAIRRRRHPRDGLLRKLIRVLAAHAKQMHREALIATRDRGLALQLLPDLETAEVDAAAG
jgi:DNA-binding transcriptional LysR family regulator